MSQSIWFKPIKDKKELLEEWQPEPLVPNYEPKENIINPRVVEG